MQEQVIGMDILGWGKFRKISKIDRQITSVIFVNQTEAFKIK